MTQLHSVVGQILTESWVSETWVEIMITIPNKHPPSLDPHSPILPDSFPMPASRRPLFAYITRNFAPSADFPYVEFHQENSHWILANFVKFQQNSLIPLSFHSMYSLQSLKRKWLQRMIHVVSVLFFPFFLPKNNIDLSTHPIHFSLSSRRATGLSWSDIKSISLSLKPVDHQTTLISLPIPYR